MPGETNCPCVATPSTIFIVDTKSTQLAANTVYNFKTAYDAAQVAAGKNTKYQFKSDWERMQYLVGKMGVVCNPPTVTNRG
jgi:hypothetical protein